MFLSMIYFFGIIQVIFSQANPSSTVTSGVHTLPVINCGTNPTTSTDCTKNTTTSEYCCYLTPKAGGSSQCVKISPQNFRTTMTSYLIDKVDYKIECNISAGSVSTPCGALNPQINTDCWNSSINQNSCCFYNSNNLTHCIWMGPVSGQISPQLVCPSSSSSSSQTPIQGQAQSLCSLETPKSLSDCSSKSTENNSCCFTSNAGTNVCVWLGNKYDGKSSLNGNMSCFSSFFQVNITALILFILALIF